MKRFKVTALIFSIFLFIFLTQTPYSANAMNAMKIINANECLSCHTINGLGGSVGPSLSKEGAKGHSIHWLKVQITNPGKHFPGSIMPEFNLKSKQLEEVAQYLESLK